VVIFIYLTNILSPSRLERVDWTDEMLNWITKYEIIVVALTLVGVATPCGDAPTRQEIQEAKANSKHRMTPMADCLYLYNREPELHSNLTTNKRKANLN
jgi:hypothetical protein